MRPARRSWRRKGQADHMDDWLMTYADMITLLLCFFALLVAAGLATKAHTKQVQMTEIVEDAVPAPLVARKDSLPDVPDGVYAQPMRSPQGSGDVAERAENNVPQSEYLPARETPQQPETIQGNLPFHDAEGEAARSSGGDGLAKFEDKGDRLTTLDISSAAFFESGSAQVSAAGKLLLRSVAADIASERYRDFQVTVEGHTDDSPIATAQFPSNWELSTARASAVVQYFIERGIAPQRLRAAGYADTFPKAPNRDKEGNPLPANQAQNRRVVIKLEKIDRP